MSNIAENMGYLVKGTLDAAAARGVLTNGSKETLIHGLLQIWHNANPKNPILTEAQYKKQVEAQQAQQPGNQ